MHAFQGWNLPRYTSAYIISGSHLRLKASLKFILCEVNNTKKKLLNIVIVETARKILSCLKPRLRLKKKL